VLITHICLAQQDKPREGHGLVEIVDFQMVGLTGKLSRCSADLSDLRDRTLRTLRGSTCRTGPAPRVRQRQRRLSPAEVVAVAQEFRAGADMRDLAREFRVHRTTISECLRKLGVPLRRQGLQDEDLAEAAGLYREGWSSSQAGREVRL
jgi:hypothetical protein